MFLNAEPILNELPDSKLKVSSLYELLTHIEYNKINKKVKVNIQDNPNLLSDFIKNFN